MRILGIERDETACNQLRVLQPLYKLRQHGLADCLTLGDWELHTENAVQKVIESDIILFQRPASEEWFRFIKLCQKHGKIIVTDYDDDPFNTHPMNPYYKFVGTKEFAYKWPTGEVDMLWEDGVTIDIERNIIRNDLFRSSFRKADLVTTTTPILEGFFKTLNKNTAVLPNLVDFYYYQKPEFVKREIRIGYQGGTSHYEDIYVIKDMLTKVMKKYDNVKFVYLGESRFNKLFQDIPSSKKEMHGWVKFISYPYKLQLLNLDIGICPLVDNVFNRNKSSIKWMDYSTVGAATIASDIPPYSETITNGQDGLLVKDNKQWEEALCELIEDKHKRLKLAENAYENVYENHNADKKAHLWRDAYEKILNQEISVEPIKEGAVV